ncbi:MAG: hypothetical protein ACREWE_01960, partial [Gammaproteobacteria bacterium]
TVQSKPPCTRPMTLLTRSFNYLKLHENVAQLLSENENVRIYCRLFDSIWGSPIARKNPSNAVQRVSLEELYAFDETEPLEAV